MPSEIITIYHDLKLSFFRFGAQIDVTRKRVRGFSSFINLKMGAWENLNTDDYLTFLPTKETEKDEVPQKIGAKYLPTDIGIYLANHSHNRVFFICNNSTYEDAKERMKFFCEKMQLPFVETPAK